MRWPFARHATEGAHLPKNFAITGVGGFIAPRHLQAIYDTGHQVVAAVDPHDAVGLLDRFSFGVRFFTEFERFDRHLEKLRRGPDADRVHYVSICSPNYLHDAHIRLALRVGADAICEKPVVINPWNLDALQELERETGRRVDTVLQLRLHPALRALHDRLRASGRSYDVRLTYVTARGPWYDVSWKGSEERSGGLVTNIGIHFFDLLLWLFGRALRWEVYERERARVSGAVEFERATVSWLLSTSPEDLPGSAADPGGRMTYRSLQIAGEEVDFSDGFADLHAAVYREVLAGNGFGLEVARPSIELCYRIRHSTVTASPALAVHPSTG